MTTNPDKECTPIAKQIAQKIYGKVNAIANGVNDSEKEYIAKIFNNTILFYVSTRGNSPTLIQSDEEFIKSTMHNILQGIFAEREKAYDLYTTYYA